MPISFNPVKILRPLDFFSSLVNDIDRAKEEIIIYSPFVGGWEKEKLYEQLKKVIKKALERGVKIKLVVDKKTLKESERTLKEMDDLGIEIYARETHVKAVVIDKDRILYLGSLNPLSYWGKDDIMIRVEAGPGPIIKSQIKKALEIIEPPKDEERVKF